MRYWIDVPEGNEAIVQSLAKEIGVELHEMSKRRMSRFALPCGAGFGDHVWRVNYKQQRIEASFSKPCSDSKKLKGLGFRWLHEDGVWYAPNSQEYANICSAMGFKQVEHVIA